MELRVVLVSGLSGSGKTTATDALEDLGYFCVDNLPLQLLGPLMGLRDRTSPDGPGVAVVVDSRGADLLTGLTEALNQVRKSGRHPEILFLVASNDVLQRRYNETRRRHPLLEDDGTMAAIIRERQLLEPLRAEADRVIDTTHLNVHDLKRAVRDSFGAGEGLPLRLQSSPEAEEFLERWAGLVEFLLPHYEAEGKPTLSIAVGCTGGQHRSVAVVEWLARRLRADDRSVSVEHRDAGRHG